MTIESIRQRVAAATPGPWTAKEWDGDGMGYVADPEGDSLADYVYRDATFIAHARTDIERLLAVAEAAAAVVEDMREARALLEQLVTVLGRPDIAQRDASPDAPLRRLVNALDALEAEP